jgi:NodT family efflux transporter outer membrane factor (OMF) lipoprotein
MDAEETRDPTRKTGILEHVAPDRPRVMDKQILSESNTMTEKYTEMKRIRYPLPGTVCGTGRKIVKYFRLSFRNCRGCILPVFCGILILLNGCAVGPDYVRPTAEIPAAFKESPGWKVAAPSDAQIKGTWWEIYNIPELNALEEQVNVSNQNVAAAEAQFRQAAALVQAARATLFPVAGASATPSRSDKATGGSGSSTRTTTSDYLLAGSVSWEIDLWGKTRRGVEASEASAQANAADLAAMRLSMQASLMQNYFQLRALDAQKKLLDETVVEYRKYLVMTKNRYASGVASKTDVLQAETQLNATRAQAIDTLVQRAQLEHAIAVLIGKPASSFSLPVAPLVAGPPILPVSIPSELLERRPDIAAAERRMAAANARIGVAEAAYYPSLSLNGTGGFDAAQFSKWLVWPSRFWSVGATAAGTLFDGGLRGAQTDQAVAAYDAGVATYRQTVLTGFQEVEDNLAALRILGEEARVQEETVKAAQQSAQISLNQYKAGIVSYLNVATAMTISLGSQITALSIASRRLVASGLLIKTLGGGWDSSAQVQEQGTKGGQEVKPKVQRATGPEESIRN